MSLELFNLSGKIALITASSGGLGLTIARGLGEAGTTVVLNGVDEDRLAQTVKSLSGETFAVYGYAFDVTKPDQIEEQVQAIKRDVGPIDILVNNAGIQVRGPLEDFAVDDWRRIIDVNLTGAFLVSKAVVQGMIARESGKIVNVCSIQSELARPTIAPYTASKGGLRNLTRGMATEWGRYNIQINGIAPGYFITEMTKPLADDEQFDAWLRARTPANRWGNPSEMIGAAIFLASGASSYVNGHILYVDGGIRVCV